MAVLAENVVMVVAGVGSFHVHDYASSKKKKDMARASQQTGLFFLIKIFAQYQRSDSFPNNDLHQT